MSKKVRQQQKANKPESKGRSRRKATVVIGLILCLGVTGAILAQLKATRAVTKNNALLTMVPPAPTPDPFSPASPSKEYIYAGGRLVATEEPNNVPASATFLKTDTTTQGNWKGVYGADGYNIVNDAVSYPSYAQVTPGSNLLATWSASTSDARALQKTASTTDRLAACWYQSSYFTIDVNLTDGLSHQVALYNLDWDGSNGRAQQIDILDATTNAVLNSQTVSSFSNGKYLVWKLSGHVIIKVTRTGVWNSVISGIFFDPNRSNVALSTNGGTASASSQYSTNFPASAAINGDRYNLYQPDNRFNEWHSAGTTFPQWLQVDFNGNKTIDEINVITQQDNYSNPIDPTEATTFTLYGPTAFEVQYWSGTSWITVPGGSVTGNNKVWRKFTFSPISTSKVRVLISATADGYSRVMELEAWGTN
jgi:hypothetical protein